MTKHAKVFKNLNRFEVLDINERNSVVMATKEDLVLFANTGNRYQRRQAIKILKRSGQMQLTGQV